MNPISPEQLIEGLSDDLQDLLIREAYIRRKRDALKAELPDLRKKEESLRQTRPAFLILRGKGTKEDFKSMCDKVREEIELAERTLAGCEIILKKCDKIIESGLEQYFEGRLESFRNARAAQKLIPEWESALGLYRVCLKRLVMTLGIARNQMSSGYDRKSGSLSGEALEAFGAALSAAKALNSEAAIPNRLAKQFRELLGLDSTPLTPIPHPLSVLPYLADINGVARIGAIKSASFEAARSGVVTLLAECEKADEDLPGVLEEAANVRASQEALYRAHIARPLAEIRALADGSVDDGRMEEVWIAMESRFVSLTG